MQYRKLGRSGTKVSEISLGGWINFEEKIAEDEAKHIIRYAYENGVNFFDLADVYGNGKAEQWMGGMLKEFPRHTLIVSTKVYWPMSDDINDRGLSRKHIMESIDRSLQRLGMDYVDIYFCHRPDDETPLYETARAMDDLIRRGKILYWGTSKWEPERVKAVYDLCQKYNLYPPQVEQPVYNLLDQENVDALAPVAQEVGMGVVVFSPLAYGMLTGKYDDGIPDDSRFATESWAAERYLNDANVERVKHLRTIAHDLAITRSQLALAWALQNPVVSSVITGATKLKQIEDNLQAVGKTLPADVMQHIAQALA